MSKNILSDRVEADVRTKAVKAVALVTLVAMFASFSAPTASAFFDFPGFPLPTMPTIVAPKISGAYTSPLTFNPGKKEKTTVNFELNTIANVTIDIFRGDSYVNSLIFNRTLGNGAQAFTWDGYDKDGLLASDGAYRFKIFASNGFGNDVYPAQLTDFAGIIVTSTPPEPAPVLSNVSLTKSTFRPSSGEKTTISFDLNAKANVTVDIVQEATLVQNLWFNTALNGGRYSFDWDGRNTGSKVVVDGVYMFKIFAVNDSGVDIKQINVVVTSTPPVPPPILVYLSSVKAEPSTFNPDTQTTALGFTVNTAVKVEVRIFDGSTVVRRIDATASSSGAYSVTWDGKDSVGAKVPAKTYTFEIYVYNDWDTKVASNTVTVAYAPVGTAPVLKDLKANPATFNPAVENTTLSYTLDKSADVTVLVLNSSGGVLRLLESASAKLTGLNSVVWNGRDSAGSLVSASVYTFRVTAANSAGSDSKSGMVTVNYGATVTAPTVSGLEAVPSPFNPNFESTTFRYTLDKTANVTVEVFSGSSVRTLLSSVSQLAGPNSVIWNGRDSSSAIVSRGSYTYRVTASNSAGSDLKSSSVIVVDYSITGTAPVLSSLYASLSPFNPNTQETTFNYSLDKAANVTVQVLDGSGRVLRLLESGLRKSSGLNSVSWNGRDASGLVVSENTYVFRITAVNDFGSDTKNGYVVVNYGSSGSMPILSSLYAIPTTFNPNNENTTLYYTLDKTATVTIQVLGSNGNTVVRTLEQNVSRASGSNTTLWNGRDTNNNLVSANFYSFRVVASNAFGSDARTTSVTVNYGGGTGLSGNVIRNLFVNPEIFNPNRGDSSSIYFNLAKAANVTTEILDRNDNIIRTLTDNVYRNPGFSSPYSTGFGSYNYSDSWNGRDRFGNVVGDNIYQFRVRANTADGESETKKAYVEVDTDGVIIGFPSNVNCIGYRDVTSYSPYCEAIKVMKEDGVFGGYADGTFRPYQSINRAETTKVVLLALRTSIVNDFGPLGFSDVGNNAWYAQYLRTAKRLGIIRGYPDGTFRPTQTVNRVELLKIFLEGASGRVPYCNTAAYVDTPINASTRWYIDYVCYAKNNVLMRDDGTGRFNPAAPMTRGDVADLFYQYENRGMFGSGFGSSFSRY